MPHRVVLTGTVRSGRREGAGFVALDWVARQVERKAGFRPYPGTLNLELPAGPDLDRWRAVRGRNGFELVPEDPAYCSAWCLPARVGGRIPAAVVVPRVAGYPDNLVEILAPVSLRQALALEDGDPCRVVLEDP